MVSYCQNEGVNSFFVVEVDMSKVNSYEIDMLYNNFVDGIIQPEFRSLDGEMLLYNKINGMKSLKDYMQLNKLSARQTWAVVDSLCSVVCEAEDYMLNPDSLMIKTEYVFCGIGAEKFKFVFAPGVDVDVRKQIRYFVEDVIRNIDHEDARLVDFLYGVYEVVIADNFDIESLKKIVNAQRDKLNTDYRVCDEERSDQEKNSPEKDQKMLNDELFGDVMTATGIKDSEGSWIEKLKKNGWFVILTVLTMVIGLSAVIFQISKYGKITDVRMFMAVVAVAVVEIFIYLEIQRKNEKARLQPVETVPVETVPVETAPMKTAPVETAPVKTAPVETAPVVIAPMRTSSVTAVPAESRTPEIYSGIGMNGTQILREPEEDTTLLVNKTGEEGIAPQLLVKLMEKKSGEIIQIRVFESETVLGRESTADIVIDDKSISRRHVSFCAKGGLAYVRDLRSTNGTFVNGIQLCQYKYWPLADGDRVRLGSREYGTQISLI